MVPCAGLEDGVQAVSWRLGVRFGVFAVRGSGRAAQRLEDKGRQGTCAVVAQIENQLEVRARRRCGRWRRWQRQSSSVRYWVVVSLGW